MLRGRSRFAQKAGLGSLVELSPKQSVKNGRGALFLRIPSGPRLFPFKLANGQAGRSISLVQTQSLLERGDGEGERACFTVDRAQQKVRFGVAWIVGDRGFQFLLGESRSVGRREKDPRNPNSRDAARPAGQVRDGLMKEGQSLMRLAFFIGLIREFDRPRRIYSWRRGSLIGSRHHSPRGRDTQGQIRSLSVRNRSSGRSKPFNLSERFRQKLRHSKQEGLHPPITGGGRIANLEQIQVRRADVLGARGGLDAQHFVRIAAESKRSLAPKGMP